MTDVPNSPHGEKRTGEAEHERWRDFPRSWRDVVLAVAILATFVALCFAPMASCKVTIGNPTTTTTRGSTDAPR